MVAFYEFHDSILNKVEWNQRQLILNLTALRTEWADDTGEREAEVFRQEIQILVEEASMEVDSPNLPNWLLGGSYHAVSQDANAKDLIDDFIPASLVRAEVVKLRLEGMNEDTNEYITIQIAGTSMLISRLSEPEFIQKLHSRT